MIILRHNRIVTQQPIAMFEGNSFLCVTLLAMKGCALSLLLQITGWLATGGGIILLLQKRCAIPPGKSFAPALFIALLLVFAAGLLLGIVRALRERRQLVSALRGAQPADGRQVVLTGTLHASGEPLTSPFSGKACVFYRYSIGRWVGSSRRKTFSTLVDGVALTEAYLRAPSGNYRLLAVPTIDGPAATLDSKAEDRAADYLRRTTFASRPEGFSRPELEKEWADDDGSYRRDVRSSAEIDLAQCTLSEHLIADGAEVALFGRYSAERAGIVADKNWSHVTRVMTGDAASLSGQLASRAIRYGLFAIALIGAACFMFRSVFDCMGTGANS
jgi:hypothetical protein